MGDIHCRICGEPWDAYGVDNGDMTRLEAKLFKGGLGCPSCKGKKPRDDARDHTDEFLESLVDPSNTDEDPVEVLSKVRRLDAERLEKLWREAIQG